MPAHCRVLLCARPGVDTEALQDLVGASTGVPADLVCDAESLAAVLPAVEPDHLIFDASLPACTLEAMLCTLDPGTSGACCHFFGAPSVRGLGAIVAALARGVAVGLIVPALPSVGEVGRMIGSVTGGREWRGPAEALRLLPEVQVGTGRLTGFVVTAGRMQQGEDPAAEAQRRVLQAIEWLAERGVDRRMGATHRLDLLLPVQSDAVDGSWWPSRARDYAIAFGLMPRQLVFEVHVGETPAESRPAAVATLLDQGFRVDVVCRGVRGEQRTRLERTEVAFDRPGRRKRKGTPLPGLGLRGSAQSLHPSARADSAFGRWMSADDAGAWTALRLELAERRRVAELSALLADGVKDDVDRMLRLAQRAFNVPCAMVSLFDGERRWSVYATTTEDHTLPDELCALHDKVLIDGGALQLSDACDPEHGGEWCFYAGAPLHLRSGEVFGVLAVAGPNPRPYGEKDRLLFAEVVRMVESELLARLRDAGGTSLPSAEPQRAMLERVSEVLGTAALFRLDVGVLYVQGVKSSEAHAVQTALRESCGTPELVERLPNGDWLCVLVGADEAGMRFAELGLCGRLASARKDGEAQPLLCQWRRVVPGQIDDVLQWIVSGEH